MPPEALVPSSDPPPDNVVHGVYRHLKWQEVHNIRLALWGGAWGRAVAAAGIRIGVVVEVFTEGRGPLNAIPMVESVGPYTYR